MAKSKTVETEEVKDNANTGKEDNTNA